MFIQAGLDPSQRRTLRFPSVPQFKNKKPRTSAILPNSGRSEVINVVPWARVIAECFEVRVHSEMRIITDYVVQ